MFTALNTLDSDACPSAIINGNQKWSWACLLLETIVGGWRKSAFLFILMNMTTQEKMTSLMREAAELPEEAQAELVQSLIEMRSQHLGTYYLDRDERKALAKSGEDVQLGRFVSDDELEELFARYGA